MLIMTLNTQYKTDIYKPSNYVTLKGGNMIKQLSFFTMKTGKDYMISHNYLFPRNHLGPTMLWTW